MSREATAVNETEDVSSVEQSFEKLRDLLLGLSHRYAKSDEREWDKAEHLFALSRKVDQLLREMRYELAVTNGTLSKKASNSDQGDGATESRERSKVARKSRRAYPKYSLRSGVLIKTGLSRDRRTEYEHAVPKSEFDRIIARLEELSSRKTFVVEDVLKTAKCPSYQVYLVIAFLKERGLLVTPRRGLYAFRRPKEFKADTRVNWDSLADA
jgi:hypothetical protein